MIKPVKYGLYFGLALIVGSLMVHMFDKDFAGKLVGEDHSKTIAAGKELYAEKGCLSCHGGSGNKPIDENYPHLGGQPRKYLEQQIKDIRDAKRTNGFTSIMKASVKGLTNEEAYLISFYLSLQ